MARRFLISVGKLVVTFPLMLIALACEVHFVKHRHESWLGMGGVVEWLGFSALLGTVSGLWGRGQPLWGSYWRWRYVVLGFLGSAALLPMAARYFGR